ncbi:minor tail protein [Gordonia phage Schmidt]|uniref:Minor tail protein n=1 Tax=Gordonia phage Schmidt TaxID=2301697 RepID=A0A385E073_9CAUD|nr:minor tail protein [Gordonia phage Schmidt]AXQ65141.1 minor tail protein [Gordonia phage Schmidt]
MQDSQVRVYWTSATRDHVWNLQAGDAGVMLAGGLSGQHFPEFDQASAEPARIPGRIYRGTRYKYRRVNLSVLVGDPVWRQPMRTGDRWRDLDSEWQGDLHEELLGRLCFITSHGYRWLDCRVDDASDPQWQTEPGKQGMAKYDYVLASDDAFYSGFPETYPILSVRESFDRGLVHNLGDYERYPVIKVQGPGLFRFGAGDRWTQLPELYAGQWLEIDTDPNRLTIVDQDGRNRRGDLPRDHDLSFVLPPGKSVELAAQVTNGTTNSRVDAVVSPRYRRAW